MIKTLRERGETFSTAPALKLADAPLFGKIRHTIRQRSVYPFRKADHISRKVNLDHGDVLEVDRWLGAEQREACRKGFEQCILTTAVAAVTTTAASTSATAGVVFVVFAIVIAAAAVVFQVFDHCP